MLPPADAPRSWCSWESPYRSAFSITMMTALGTSTPTSTTVVETRSWVSPREKEAITCSFSAGFIRPWSTPTEAWGKAFSTSAAYWVTLCMPLSSSSIRGQMR